MGARPTRIFAAGLLSILGIALLSVDSHAALYTVYSDYATVGRDVYTWGTPGTQWNGTFEGVVPPEGTRSFQTVSNGFGGWGVFYDPALPADLSAYAGGQLRFWVRSNTGYFKAEIEYADHSKSTWDLSPYWEPANANVWVLFELPLTGVRLTDIYSPFQITALTVGTVEVDHVHYYSSDANPGYQVTLRNRSDNTAATRLNFNGAAIGSWVVADQYIELELSPDRLSWGVQIYTDNTAADANPRFVPTVPVGEPGSNPAGLVDTINPSNRIPLAWSVKGATVEAPSSANPNNAGDPNSFQWLFMLDRATPDIPAQNTNAFSDGLPFATVKTQQGIRYGQGPTEIGPSDATNRIYLQADLRTAVTPRTYRTNKLRVEFYEQ
jgi:hypothetical protein